MVGIGGTQRIVTVLMVDVVDSTAIAERLGPARSKFLFDEIVALMAREVERLDGTVAQLTGDGLLALFGAPIGHEDDPERAVRAALAIRDVVSAYGDDVREAYEVTIAVRVAVNTGPVALAETDVPDAERYNALGDTVNVAARLQSAVANGAIVVGPETARQVRDAFDLEALGEFALKGIARTVAAYGVTCERGPARVRALAPLVGRDRERSVLAGAFDTVLDGSGAILTVVGEPGIGKSRLLAEIRRDFGERVRFLEGRGSSYAESFPYWPVRDLLRDWLGIAADAPEARLRLELKSALADLAAPSDAYTLIAPLVGISPPGEIGAALRDLGTEAIQQRTFAAVRDVVRRLAERQPLALVIDDLQWADTATLDLLQDLLSLTEEMPLAVVLAYRAERERASWRLGDHARAQYPHRHCEIELRPLDGADSRAFAAALAEIALPREVVDLLADRSGGNPFFLEEALQDLIERRALQRRDGAWVLADGESAAIPAVVQGVLQARLDRLPPATREVVSIASAIGRGFGLPLLERLLPRDQVVPALSSLMRLDLIVEVRRRPTSEYRFRHGLMQEVAYGALLEPVRRSVHRRIGEALETLHGDARDEVYGLLGHHFAEADDPARAARYLLAAGDAARAVYANQEAVEHYRRARLFLTRLDDPDRERDTLFKIALVHHLAFDYVRAGQAYDAAFNCKVHRPSEREGASERLELSLWPPRAYAPGDSYYTDSAVVIEQLFRGLLRIDAELNVVPELAQNMNVSADGLTYLFMLREDACWSDGERLTAGDFVYAWTELRSEQLITAFLLEDIESAIALDDWTLELRLRAPRNYFPYVLASHWAYPWPRHLAEVDSDAWRQPESLVGNGPFVLDSSDDRGIDLRANPRWSSAPGNVGAVAIRFIDGGDAPDHAWASGGCDLEYARPGANASAADTIVEYAPLLGTAFLALNAEHELIRDERVRLALAHAIDTSVIADASDVGIPANRGGAIPRIMPGHSPAVTVPHDPERARELLGEAGYPDGAGLPVLDLSAPPWFRSERLAEQLRAVGFETRFSTEAGPWLTARDRHGSVISWLADYPDPDGFYLGLRWTGLPVYRDPATDALFERARASRDRDERLRLYREFERIWIGERAAIVPLSYRRAAFRRKAHVHGVAVNPVGLLHLEQVVIDRRHP